MPAVFIIEVVHVQMICTTRVAKKKGGDHPDLLWFARLIGRFRTQDAIF
jgi:hypothetical protein